MQFESWSKKNPAPKAGKVRRNALETHEAWLMLKAKILDGLAPYEESVGITITPDDKEKLGLKVAPRLLKKMAVTLIRKIHRESQLEVLLYKTKDPNLPPGTEVLRLRGIEVQSLPHQIKSEAKRKRA